MGAIRTLGAYGASLRQAMATLAGHPLRSSLGVLAIAVAVATLTLVQTAVEGLGTYALKSASRSFGSDTFVLAQIASRGRISRRELARKLERNPPVRRSDLRFLESQAGGRGMSAATAQQVADVTAGGARFENASVSGTGSRLTAIRDLGIEQGRVFTPGGERRGAPGGGRGG